MAYNETKGMEGIQGLFDPNGYSQVNMIKCVKIDIAVPKGTDEITIHAALPENAYVKDALLKVVTVEATGLTKTVNIGTATATSGDPDGFVASGAVDAKGIVVGAGALVGTVLSGKDAIVVTAASADFAEFTGELYLFYIEV